MPCSISLSTLEKFCNRIEQGNWFFNKGEITNRKWMIFEEYRYVDETYPSGIPKKIYYGFNVIPTKYLEIFIRFLIARVIYFVAKVFILESNSNFKMRSR